eukprot:s37_g5.t1
MNFNPPETVVQIHFPMGGDRTVDHVFPALGLVDVGCEVGEVIFPAMLASNRMHLPLVYDIAPAWVPWDEPLQSSKRLFFIFVNPKPMFNLLQYLAVHLPQLEIDLCPADLPQDRRESMWLHLICFPGPDIIDGLHRLHDRANRMHGRVQTLEHQVQRLQQQVDRLVNRPPPNARAARPMGSSLSTQSDDAATDECASEPPALRRPDIDCNISESFRANMHEAINEAHATTTRADPIVLPWEMPSMSWVFGETDPLDFPFVAPVLGYVEPVEQIVDTRPDHVVQINPKGTFFEGAIAFNSFRTCHLDEGSQLSLLAQKWEAVVSINYSAFDLGIEIFEIDFKERAKIMSEVLGGKSPATLSRRLSQISRYVRWATNDAKRLPFPVTSELIKNYVRHLRNEASAHTAFKGFAEVLKFMKHVVGLDCDLAAFESAWVSGVIRSAQQSRPLRKQSTTLNVKTLQYLENFLCNQEHSVIDRFAAGVFLFAIYSRSRFGDLRRIAKIIIDPATEESEGSLGYIEMHSASHKMRATGNRLSAHLPLIAPIKGLGERA